MVSLTLASMDFHTHGTTINMVIKTSRFSKIEPLQMWSSLICSSMIIVACKVSVAVIKEVEAEGCGI